MPGYQSYPTPPALTDSALADKLDSGGIQGGNKLHERVDIAPNYVVAGFHALDGRHRKTGQFGQLPLIDA